MLSLYTYSLDVMNQWFINIKALNSGCKILYLVTQLTAYHANVNVKNLAKGYFTEVDKI